MLAGLFLVAGLSALSLPGLSPFVSEFLVLVGTFTLPLVVGAFAALGIVLAALYILLMYQRTMTGPVRAGDRRRSRDLNRREVGAVAPLLLLIVVLGFFPKPLLDVINPAVDDHDDQRRGDRRCADGARRHRLPRRTTSDRVLQARRSSTPRSAPMLIVFGVALRSACSSRRSCPRARRYVVQVVLGAGRTRSPRSSAPW